MVCFYFPTGVKRVPENVRLYLVTPRKITRCVITSKLNLRVSWVSLSLVCSGQKIRRPPIECAIDNLKLLLSCVAESVGALFTPSIAVLLRRQEWVTATDIRIVLTRLNTFGDEIFGDKQVLRSYYYAIADLAVGGR